MENKNNFENINGIFYRELSKVIITAPRKQTTDINQIPSPYITGCISLKTYKAANIETNRGCTFRCTYCIANLRGSSCFSAERVANEIEFIIKEGMRYAFIIDTNFLRSPNFNEICRKIKAVNESRKIEFATNVCAEDVNEINVDLLKECNILKVEVGLQSIHSPTQKKINRPPFNENKFLEGIRLLKEREIKLSTSIIIGLPDENLQDFQSTLKFARKNEISPICHVLQIYPGARLWNESGKYGIKHLYLPPYLITQTRRFSKYDIEKAINLVNNKSRKQNIPISFIRNFNTRNLGHRKVLRSHDKNIHLNHCINKVILPLETQSMDQLNVEGKMLAKQVGQPFTAWLKKNSFDGDDFDLIEAFIQPIAAANPYIPMHVILETEMDFTLSKIKGVRKTLRNKDILFSNSQKVIDRFTINTILPWKNYRNIKRLKNFTLAIPVYWFINITNQSNWQEILNDSLNENNSWGIIMDFDPDIELNVLIEILEFLCNKNIIKKKDIFFSNLVIDSLFKSFNLKQESGKFSIVNPEFESILTYDENLNIASFLEPNPETKLDFFIWQKRIQNDIKKRI